MLSTALPTFTRLKTDASMLEQVRRLIHPTGV